MTSSLHYELLDGIATITLDDGKANVMSFAMLAEILSALAKAEADSALVVICGRPGMFSGGFDLATFKRSPNEIFQMLKAGAELTERMLSFPYPVVVICTGHAIAMGAFLLLSADYRIGTRPDAKIQTNEVQIGLTLPHFAIEVCRQRLAPAHFSLAAVTAHVYEQAQAVGAGFLDEVTSPESLPDVLKKRIDHLRSLHMDSFVATKLRLRSMALVSLRAAIERDVEDWSRRFDSEAS